MTIVMALAKYFWRGGFILVVMVALPSACVRQDQNAMTEHKPVTSVWQRLAQKRVLFAHQSVGENILAGVVALEGQSDRLLIRKARVVEGPGITHFDVGSNGDPLHKIEDFTGVMNSSTGVDAALLKFCFWDFNPENRKTVDARTVAKAYTETLDRLAIQYPQTAFVAATVPLMTVQAGWRGWFKRLLGKPPSGFEDNARRADFNDIVRTHFKNSGRLFDIAKLESSGRGATTTATANGRTIEVLDPALTSDGGHLNDDGKKLIATEMLLLLESVTRGGAAQ